MVSGFSRSVKVTPILSRACVGLASSLEAAWPCRPVTKSRAVVVVVSTCKLRATAQVIRQRGMADSSLRPTAWLACRR